MVAKKIVVALFCTILASGAVFYSSSNKQIAKIQNDNTKNTKHIEQPKAKTQPQEQLEKKYDLYSSSPYDLPLLSIYEISKLSNETKKLIDTILEEAQGFYLLKKIDDRILILLQNPIVDNKTFPRHELQYVEIFPDGSQQIHNAGYIGLEGEIYKIEEKKIKDWTFDTTTESYRPLKHIEKDNKGKIIFTEQWSYDPDKDIKYIMKDSQGKTMSILKETQESDTNYRKEHVFYDNNGNIIVSITINYDGANISRFTYYNSHDLVDSISVISEFEDGLKIKESIYNEDYEIINTIVSKYQDEQRKEIQILNKDGEIIDKISS